ncbi:MULTISPECIES: tetratricopeptide repeat protein [unclassified Chelatococcus]|uniref:tetratricopeptide repeat protein n=1 Tax=unclassified Chelatococcus TaxID=2638111 RepID=UPI001BCE7318|nr:MULTISPECIES: tetratricopeptide repeat protein [unclassified Chelatococcus]CAH1668866.1 TPR_REGION domain-containing protein [Hyphomicrobiales bacterium]MBS7739407.1 tetratricopeptide repeat protein [Chelatococcus sp. HY11]MBX3543776.1 tetratricopeptide repeat protein [Chelatococcus sp.]MCO5076058.1 tetratricopeptide repeat protein [Chelatococcus sp.]CAH1679669.1 TPR_REGION domain-containing protein [Hyphomicrobiales bacterium]
MRTIARQLGTLSRRPLVLALAAGLLVLAAAWSMVGWQALWASPDQRGRWLFERGHYGDAADAFIDPLWRGAALMRAGRFKEAEQAFAGLEGAEAAFDQGNALVMLGRYQEAVSRYDRALALRPGWADATANRNLAALRAERMKAPGGDAGDQREGADQIVYDKDAKNTAGQETEISATAMSDEQVRALWLKRVATKPADFLRARFANQLQASSARGNSP